MRIETMILFLLLMFSGYVIISYKKLKRQVSTLDSLYIEIQTKRDKLDNTDTLRREYNAIVREYNHTLEGFIGRYIARKLNYDFKAIIEKI